MIYSAIVKRAGTDAGTWVLTPQYTTDDGQTALDIIALSANGIIPVAGDIVLCAESINDFEHSKARDFDYNGGANPVIIGVFSQLLTTLCDVTIQGDAIIQGDATIQGEAKLGAGTKKMVLGDDLATWALSVDLALTTLSAAVGGVLPPIVASLWTQTNLSTNHTLD